MRTATTDRHTDSRQGGGTMTQHGVYDLEGASNRRGNMAGDFSGASAVDTDRRDFLRDAAATCTRIPLNSGTTVAAAAVTLVHFVSPPLPAEAAAAASAGTLDSVMHAFSGVQQDESCSSYGHLSDSHVSTLRRTPNHGSSRTRLRNTVRADVAGKDAFTYSSATRACYNASNSSGAFISRAAAYEAAADISWQLSRCEALLLCCGPFNILFNCPLHFESLLPQAPAFFTLSAAAGSTTTREYISPASQARAAPVGAAAGVATNSHFTGNDTDQTSFHQRYRAAATGLSCLRKTAGVDENVIDDAKLAARPVCCNVFEATGATALLPLKLHAIVATHAEGLLGVPSLAESIDLRDTPVLATPPVLRAAAAALRFICGSSSGLDFFCTRASLSLIPTLCSRDRPLNHSSGKDDATAQTSKGSTVSASGIRAQNRKREGGSPVGGQAAPADPVFTDTSWGNQIWPTTYGQPRVLVDESEQQQVLLQPTSSGFCLGGANWLLQVPGGGGLQNVFVVGPSCFRPTGENPPPLCMRQQAPSHQRHDVSRTPQHQSRSSSLDTRQDPSLHQEHADRQSHYHQPLHRQQQQQRRGANSASEDHVRKHKKTITRYPIAADWTFLSKASLVVFFDCAPLLSHVTYLHAAYPSVRLFPLQKLGSPTSTVGCTCYSGLSRYTNAEVKPPYIVSSLSAARTALPEVSTRSAPKSSVASVLPGAAEDVGLVVATGEEAATTLDGISSSHGLFPNMGSCLSSLPVAMEALIRTVQELIRRHRKTVLIPVDCCGLLMLELLEPLAAAVCTTAAPAGSGPWSGAAHTLYCVGPGVPALLQHAAEAAEWMETSRAQRTLAGQYGLPRPPLLLPSTFDEDVLLREGCGDSSSSKLLVTAERLEDVLPLREPCVLLLVGASLRTAEAPLLLQQWARKEAAGKQQQRVLLLTDRRFFSPAADRQQHHTQQQHIQQQRAQKQLTKQEQQQRQQYQVHQHLSSEGSSALHMKTEPSMSATTVRAKHSDQEAASPSGAPPDCTAVAAAAQSFQQHSPAHAAADSLQEGLMPGEGLSQAQDVSLFAPAAWASTDALDAFGSATVERVPDRQYKDECFVPALSLDALLWPFVRESSTGGHSVSISSSSAGSSNTSTSGIGEGGDHGDGLLVGGVPLDWRLSSTGIWALLRQYQPQAAALPATVYAQVSALASIEGREMLLPRNRRNTAVGLSSTAGLCSSQGGGEKLVTTLECMYPNYIKTVTMERWASEADVRRLQQHFALMQIDLTSSTAAAEAASTAAAPQLCYSLFTLPVPNARATPPAFPQVPGVAEAGPYTRRSNNTGVTIGHEAGDVCGLVLSAGSHPSASAVHVQQHEQQREELCTIQPNDLQKHQQQAKLPQKEKEQNQGRQRRIDDGVVPTERQWDRCYDRGSFDESGAMQEMNTCAVSAAVLSGSALLYSAGDTGSTSNIEGGLLRVVLPPEAMQQRTAGVAGGDEEEPEYTGVASAWRQKKKRSDGHSVGVASQGRSTSGDTAGASGTHEKTYFDDTTAVANDTAANRFGADASKTSTLLFGTYWPEQLLLALLDRGVATQDAYLAPLPSNYQNSTRSSVSAAVTTRNCREQSIGAEFSTDIQNKRTAGSTAAWTTALPESSTNAVDAATTAETARAATARHAERYATSIRCAPEQKIEGASLRVTAATAGTPAVPAAVAVKEARAGLTSGEHAKEEATVTIRGEQISGKREERDATSSLKKAYTAAASDFQTPEKGGGDVKAAAASLRREISGQNRGQAEGATIVLPSLRARVVCWQPHLTEIEAPGRNVRRFLRDVMAQLLLELRCPRIQQK